MSLLVQRTTDGAAVTRGAGETPIYVKSVTLLGGSAASTLVISDDTDGSTTDLLTLKAAIDTVVTWKSGDPQGVAFFTAVYCDLTGAAAVAQVEYSRQ